MLPNPHCSRSGRWLRSNYRVVVIVTVVAVLVTVVTLNAFMIVHRVTYLTRPLWDSNSEETRWKTVTNFGTKPGDPELYCPLHGWAARSGPAPRVFDVFVFNMETHMLEIRLNELDAVVDKFVVIEAKCTFNRQPKSSLLADHLDSDEFRAFRAKIHYVLVDICNDDLEPGFPVEGAIRSHAIRETRQAGAVDGDLFIFSDLDELPRLDSIKLLRSCDFGPRIHLQLDNYRYSFGLPAYPESTHRSTVSVIGRFPDKDLVARFGYLTDAQLGDAGWHCSWCFPTVDMVRQKMLGYSHSDRIHSQHLLDEDEIRRKMCTGEDMFEFLPEGYTFHSLACQMRIVPKTGDSHVPDHVARNPTRFRFLLPGACDAYWKHS
ncbi:Beta-1,4-mannosyl-glycoprotein beta-1,4-N-acetylglucosaminyltransferase [Plasmodiophora brassicae]|uniref:Beta-1,4-mannosyl-glycoprotein beta-1,4-N-acetylglucosaminyltransferase n=1 Tax=Plasmodiophora brassicae TaxID=37360 RepID=A0A0G4IRM6_PLABS|nr:hypothetical protein PBRA_005918 [Plasmodiophora brassicae]SPQ98349.1 unnamed protein product [Plasmodiophora brassicae]